MSKSVARGLILETADHSETSLRAALFVEEQGLLAVFARGARRGGRSGHLAAGLAPFASGEALFARKGDEGPGTLIELNLTAERGSIRLDLDAYAAGAPVLELLRGNPTTGPDTFRALRFAEGVLDHLDALASEAGKLDSAQRVAGRGERRAAYGEALGLALLGYLRLCGHVPIWTECPVAKRPLEHLEPSSFSVEIGGRISREGASELMRRGTPSRDLRPLSRSTLEVMARWIAGESILADESPDLGFRRLERPLNLLAVFAREHVKTRLESYKFFRQRFFGDAWANPEKR